MKIAPIADIKAHLSAYLKDHSGDTLPNYRSFGGLASVFLPVRSCLRMASSSLSEVQTWLNG